MYKVNQKDPLAYSALLVLFTLLSCASQAYAGDSASIEQGRKLYQVNCASCHGKDLSGGIGFNLKDGEWVHGDEPSAISQNIAKGFAAAGMPGFKMILGDSKIDKISAYILSKREGFKNLNYKIYKLKDDDDISLEGKTHHKQGKLHNNLADFTLPEVKEFGIEFEGDLYTLTDKDTKLMVQVHQDALVTVEIDGKPAERISQKWMSRWKLKRGKQHIKLVYLSSLNSKRRWAKDNLRVLVSSADEQLKLFPLSTRSAREMQNKKIELKAENALLIQRKKVYQLPSRSISMGFPSKVNVAFGAKQCGIVGLWQGEFLNVGPNVDGRGKDSSVPLGDWVFHKPQVLGVKDAQHCRYELYEKSDGVASFHFQVDDLRYQLQIESKDQSAVSLHYKVSAISKAQVKNAIVQFSLPVSDKARYSSSQGVIKNNELSVDIVKHPEFSINVNIGEAN